AAGKTIRGEETRQIAALFGHRNLTLDILRRKRFANTQSESLGLGGAPLRKRGLLARFALRAQDIRQWRTMTPASDFSFLGLFLQAHPVVKIVMIGLILASIWCWSIVIEKSLAFARARNETDEFERIFWSGQSLDELYLSMSQKRPSAMAALF